MPFCSRMAPVKRVSRSARRGPVPLAAAAIAVLSLTAAACGGGDGSLGTEIGAAQETRAETAVGTSRTGMGMTAAGGSAAGGGTCPPPGSAAAAGTVTIAAVTPDIDRLHEVGLGNLELDAWENILESYIAEVNGFGGVNGHCFALDFHEYGFATIVEDIGAICSEVPQAQPLLMLGLALDPVVPQCTTIPAEIPTVGLYTQFSETVFAAAGGRLHVDHGSTEFLLENGLRTAASTGVLGPDETIGLLHSGDESAQAMESILARTANDLNREVAATAAVPAVLEDAAAAVTEERFHAVGGRLFHPDEGAFENAVLAMRSEAGDEAGALVATARQYFLAAATEMRDAGVTIVLGASYWTSVRNLMRAAELIGWNPHWIITDAQFPQLVLTDAPVAQTANTVQISTKRAAGDSIGGLDQACRILRNTGVAADPFDYRHQSDAWLLLTETCDYLDIIFAAISRTDGPLNRESFLAALAETDYRTAHGQRVRFSEQDMFGSDSFRVLRADPDCALNTWGCMRPVTDWLELATGAGPTNGTE